jgi:hypothetical protein
MSDKIQRYSVLARIDPSDTEWRPYVVADEEGLYNLHADHESDRAELLRLLNLYRCSAVAHSHCNNYGYDTRCEVCKQKDALEGK